MTSKQLEKLLQTEPNLARRLAEVLLRDVDEPASGNLPPVRSVEVSLIFPIFNEQENIAELYRRVVKAIDENRLDETEIIFVNDGSSDRSEELIRNLRSLDKRVKLINFSRNFGHQAAITAGMQYAIGEAVMIMDADLQDPPEVLGKILESWRNGGEVIYAVREKRKESAFRRLTYFMFYRILQKIANIDMPLDSGDFCLMDRRVVDQINQLPERNRFVRGLRSWVGFRQISFPYERHARYSGEAKYNFRKLVQLALNGIFSFSSLPLRLATYMGFAIVLFASIYALSLIIAYFVFGHFPQGWTSLMVVVLFVGGVQLLILGAIGEYVARINDEVKQRPNFVVREFLD